MKEAFINSLTDEFYKLFSKGTFFIFKNILFCNNLKFYPNIF